MFCDHLINSKVFFLFFSLKFLNEFVEMLLLSGIDHSLRRLFHQNSKSKLEKQFRSTSCGSQMMHRWKSLGFGFYGLRNIDWF